MLFQLYKLYAFNIKRRQFSMASMEPYMVTHFGQPGMLPVCLSFSRALTFLPSYFSCFFLLQSIVYGKRAGGASSG